MIARFFFRAGAMVMLLGAAMTAEAQVQRGYTKTKGRLNSDGSVTAGERLENVTVQAVDRTAVLSDQKGEFTLPIPGRKFRIQSVTKKGYQLVDPDLLGRDYEFSDNPLILAMETPDSKLSNDLAIERRVRRSLEKSLHAREDELEQLQEQHKITVEEYRTRLQQLYKDQETGEKMIREMVERYSKIDFDQVNEFNQKFSTFILNGELTRADSLLRTKGDLEGRIAAYEQHKAANEKEREDLDRRKEQLSKSERIASLTLADLGEECHQHFELCKMRFQRDSAAYFIERRAALDTLNIDWQIDAGEYIRTYLADYAKALQYHERALRQSLQQYDENHPTTATCYNNIGGAYDCKGNYDIALEYFTKALNIELITLGENHPDTAISYNNIGVVHSNKGDYDQALEYQTKALNIDLITLGENHPDTAISYNNIGLAYKNKGDYDQALEYQTKALNIRLATLGENHPDTADSYCAIGVVHCNKDDYDQALEYYKKALRISLATLGENHPNTATCYNNIGLAYDNKGAYDQALEYHTKALRIYLATFGENHPETAISYNHIGNNYYNQGYFDQALNYYTKALHIRRAYWGENHVKTASIYFNIGISYYLKEEYEKALEYLHHSLTIYKRFLPSDDPTIQKLVEFIQEIQQEQRDATGNL